MFAAERFAAVERRGAQHTRPLARTAEKLRRRQIIFCLQKPQPDPGKHPVLHRRGKQLEFPAQQLPQHVVIAVDAARAGDNKSVVVRQIVQQNVCVRLLPDEGRLRARKFLGDAVV